MFTRSSGLLLHITSLPSLYGIGDLGPSAYHFADFLEEAGQTWWQILPTNPVGRDSNYSPYSGLSAFAGNTLLLSPEMLYRENLLDKSDLDSPFRNGQVPFQEVEDYKGNLFDKAFTRWKQIGKNSFFDTFCKENSGWLDDYALYTALRKKYGPRWADWPEDLRNRDHQALAAARQENHEARDREKFLQYEFWRQWESLKFYCRLKKIKLFGDMPIYVDYLSCDVWSHRDIFKLDSNGEMTAVAGVPPDYFSEEGQLWNMPVYDWDTQKEKGYKWWIDRIGQNLSSYDVVRLDHFRGFADYWEVPAGEETAINGKWERGPREGLFAKLKEQFPEMPIIAEDLGEIDQPVYDLMDAYNLPGMRVLQFAWGDNLGKNPHSPHMHQRNLIAYTGTHDNIPVKAWYDTLDDFRKQQVNEYAGAHIDRDSVNLHFTRITWQSVASIAIAPVQDILGLGREGIMNIPSVAKGNWLWRMDEWALTEDTAEWLRTLTAISGRLP